jgi:hypothetical protein
MMAVPGDAACRPVADCGSDPYGGAPDLPTTEYVNQATSCAATDTDCGSREKPWPTIQAALTVAAADATVAIAEGTYPEEVIVRRRMTLWGRCPELVTIEGQIAESVALAIYAANGARVRGIAVTGPGVGVLVSISSDVTLEQMWIHDTALDALRTVTTAQRTAGFVLRDSLIEGATDYGILLYGAGTATIERSHVRATRTTLQRGIGVFAPTITETDRTADLTVLGSLIEDHYIAGISLIGGSLTVDGSVVRNTRSAVTNGQLGPGIYIGAKYLSEERATATLRSSWLSGNRAEGIFVVGSQVTIEGVVVRDTLGQDTDGAGGIGIAIGRDAGSGATSDVTISSSLVLDNFQSGIAVFDSVATVKSTVIAGTRVEVLRNDFGDGAVVRADSFDATLTLESSLLNDNARAGVALFGGRATVGPTIGRCNLFGVVGEMNADRAFVFEGIGENRCGCPEASDACQLVSPGVAAPPPVTPL